ncbi:hypothetical protein LTR56_015956 [Elasticomyces elasticus]|nr:hypothetical protein LTR56_015956 [Elasticomyces elasticus]
MFVGVLSFVRLYSITFRARIQLDLAAYHASVRSFSYRDNKLQHMVEELHSMVELCFVAHKEPTQGPSTSRTSAIRSHARRAVHRQARHERMREYQRQNPTSVEDRQQEEGAIVHGLIAIGSPFSCLDSLRRDPFQSLALPMNDVEQMLIDYYVYTYQVATQWVPFAFADRCLLNGLLLQACRKIAALQGQPQPEHYERLALKYKIACIRLLRALVSSGPTLPSDTLIAGSLFLALDEVRDALVH